MKFGRTENLERGTQSVPARPRARNPKLGAQYNHVVSAARRPLPCTCSAAPEANPHGLGRTLSQTRSSVLPRASVGTSSQACISLGAGGNDTAIAVEPQNFGLTSRSQPGSDSRREGSEWRPIIGSLRHEHMMEQPNGTITEVDHCKKDRRTKRV